MTKDYRYKAFGLHFVSGFEIPELLPSEKEGEICIQAGKVPKKLNDPIKKGVRYQSAKNEFLLTVDNIASFYIKNGNAIVVQPEKPTIDKEVRLFLLGSAFGALFIQRGLLPIHGSTIKFGESAVIFSGLSGVGKSSIAAHFVRQGYHILADDISVVNKQSMVEPGFPTMKIWKDVLKNLGIDSDSLDTIRPEIQKFGFPVKDYFYQYPLPVKAIFILNTKNTPGYEFEELKGMQKFNVIKKNTFRYHFIEGLYKQQEHFMAINQLIPDINVFRVSRPQAPIRLDELADFLINNFDLNG